MRIPYKVRIIALIVAGIIVTFIFAQALGVFDEQPYRVVPHGDHNHYVPRGVELEVPMDQFPTEEPREGERITSHGQVVRDE